MRFTVIFPLIALYVFLRGVYPLFRGKMRWLSFLVFIPVALTPTIARYVGGPMVAPDLSPFWIVVGDYVQLVVLFCAVIVGVRDVATILTRPFGLRLNRWTGSRVLMSAAFVFAMVLTAASEWHGLLLPGVQVQRIAVPHLPEALQGLRIAHLSDIHVSGLFRADRTQAIVDRTNAAKPDLVVITGDYVDGSPEGRGSDVKPLADLRAPMGVWGCEGNHEHYVDYDGWMRFFAEHGIRLLRNEHAVLTDRGYPLVIAGVTDPVARKYARTEPNLQQALKDAPEGFVILLAHQPKSAPEYARYGVDLMLSGHTHGGQMPGLDVVVKATNGGFVEGIYRVNPHPESTSSATTQDNRSKMTLYVHPGTQVWNGFPLRLGTSNQITLLELVRAE